MAVGAGELEMADTRVKVQERRWKSEGGERWVTGLQGAAWFDFSLGLLHCYNTWRG